MAEKIGGQRREAWCVGHYQQGRLQGRQLLQSDPRAGSDIAQTACGHDGIGQRPSLPDLAARFQQQGANRRVHRNAGQGFVHLGE